MNVLVLAWGFIEELAGGDNKVLSCKTLLKV